MKNKLSAFVYKTRGIYMFIAIAISMVIKFYSGGTTALLFFIMGLALATVTQIFRVYAASYLWGRQAVAKPEAEFLSTGGPYGYVRNPMYIGNFFIGLSLSIAINEWYACTLFILSYIFVYLLVIPYEERYLQKRFGKLYTEYKAHVGRFIPKFNSYKKGAKVTPNYRAGILGEIHVPIFLAVIFTAIYFLFLRY